MQLTHTADPHRSAEISQSAPTSYLLRWQDEAGKLRRKTFKKQWAQDAQRACVNFAFKQGFFLPAPGAQGLRWMTATHEPFPVGPLFAVDRAQQQVWVGDTGFLRRVQPGSCQVQALPLGGNVKPRGLSCSPLGHVAALLLVEERPLSGSSPWLAPSQGDDELVLVRVEGDTLRPVHRLPFDVRASVVDCASVSARGTVLGPHQEGAAIFGERDEVLRSFAVARTNHHLPRAALSPCGAVAAYTAPGGAVGFLDVDSGEHRLVEAGFSQVHRVLVGASGAAYVSGFLEPYWGVYLVKPGQAPRWVSPDVLATPALDESGVWEADMDRVFLRSLQAPEGGGEPGPRLSSTAHLPMGMSRRAEIQPLNQEELVLQTDTHRLVGLRLDTLGPVTG
jgi:hypothetical protein